MAQFVLDTSIVIAWCFEDEVSSYAETVLDRLAFESVIAPGIWPLEVGNVLVVAKRRERISKAESVRFLELLQQLPIEVDLSSEQRMFGTIINLAREQKLSTYDAAYLDLAMQTGLQLVTLDNNLREAAVRCGVAIFLEEGS